MKTLFAFLVSLISLSAIAQKEGTKYYFKDIGLSLVLPSSFRAIAEDSALVLTEHGTNLMNDATGVTADLSGFRILLCAKKNNFDFFQVSIQRFQEDKDGNWYNNLQKVKDLFYSTYVEKLKKVKIDTASSSVRIDGILFDKFSNKVTLNAKMNFTTVLISKLYKGYDLGISYLYLDENTKMEIETILKVAKFDK